MDELLKQYYEALGNDPKNYAKFNSFLTTLAEAESFSGKRQNSSKSTAKGIYHYLDKSVITSDNRIKNLYKKHKVKPDLQKLIDAELKLPIDKRSKETQSIMVLSDLMESPNAPYSDWQAGKVSDQELYYKGHHGTSSNAVSSKEKVYENWNNATMRVKKRKAKNNKYHDGGEATDITAPRFSELGMGDQFKNLFNPGAAGSMLDLAGGPLGLANIAAGVAAPLVSMAFDNPLQKTNTGNLEDFDFGAKYSRTDAKKTAKTDATFDAIGGAMEGIPLIGNILGLGMDGFKGISRLFNRGSSNKQIMGDYMAQFRQQNQAQKKELYANAFNSQAAMGGEFPGTGGNGVYNIQMNDTHEQNPMGGYTFGMAPDGSKNTAEAGEVIIDGKDGNKLVFTNKF